jgi:hypothetical protein
MQGCTAARLSRGNSVRATLNYSRNHLFSTETDAAGTEKAEDIPASHGAALSSEEPEATCRLVGIKEFCGRRAEPR